MAIFRFPGAIALALLVGVITFSTARAEDKDLLKRLEALEKQNEELKKNLKKNVDSYLKEKDDKKKLDDAAKAKTKEDEGFEVGKQLDVKGKWTNSQLWFETEDKAFRLHIGGRAQIDAVWVHAPKDMMVAPSMAGIGKFDDAVNYRRARVAMEGTLWEVFDFNFEWDFSNSFRFVPSGNVLRDADSTNSRTLNNLVGTLADRQNVANTPVPTDLWFQWSQIPFLGNIRVGNQKAWISFEHLTSSRWLDFMERSTAFDAFIENGNNGFQPGISVFNYYFDQRMLVAAGVYKSNFRDIFGWNVGDGEYQFTGRVAGTPVNENNGRCLVHLGLGYSHYGSDDGGIRWRARPQLRNGPGFLHNTVAVIQAQAHNLDLINPEIAINYGPFNLSAEYYYAQARMRPGDAFQIVGNQTGSVLPSGGRGTLAYQGGYLTLGYFLTGDYRPYNQKTASWDRQSVNEPAFVVDGDHGLQFGRGSVEVLARYSWLDLASQGVNGGTLHSGTFGINWQFNPNAKLQINYDIGYRDATQYSSVIANGKTVGGLVTGNGNSIRDGVYQGIGTRLAFDW